MKKWSLRTAAALFAAALLLTRCFAAGLMGAPSAPNVSAHCALLMDAASGRVLYQKNADEKSRIASTTKIMTGLLACECLPFEQMVCVPAEACGIEGSSLYLKPGETLPVRTLVYGLLLHSGNDAAAALALACDGSIERFAQRMNRRAAQLGMQNTHFCNPSGLDEDGHYSTARDLALLARAAMRNEHFAAAVGTKSIVLGARSLTNHNRLLWSYPGATGVKTGYTRAAGRVLVSSAARGGISLIAVTIDAPDDWNDHTALLDYGFSAFEHHTFLRGGEEAGQCAVIGGAQEHVALVCGESLRCALLPGECAELRIHAPRYVFAPVLYAQAGYADVLLNGECVCKTPLYFKNSVPLIEKKGFFARLFGG